jgi:hypothetical protein
MMRALVNVLALFWVVHFAISGLGHAAASGSGTYFMAFAGIGLDATAALAAFQLVGFLKFAVAALFLLTLAMRLAGSNEQAEALIYCGWASAGAVLVLMLEHALGLAAGQSGDVFAALAALAATLIAARQADADASASEEAGEEQVLHPAERADAAAMTAELIHLPTWRPRR